MKWTQKIESIHIVHGKENSNWILAIMTKHTMINEAFRIEFGIFLPMWVLAFYCLWFILFSLFGGRAQQLSPLGRMLGLGLKPPVQPIPLWSVRSWGVYSKSPLEAALTTTGTAILCRWSAVYETGGYLLHSFLAPTWARDSIPLVTKRSWFLPNFQRVYIHFKPFPMTS